MIEMRVKRAIDAGVTFVHVFARSRLTWIRPSSEPVQRMSAVNGDSANAKIDAYHSVPVMSYVIGPPAGPSVFGSCSVRSPLTASQLLPSFSERNTRLAVTYRTFESCFEKTMGNVH